MARGSAASRASDIVVAFRNFAKPLGIDDSHAQSLDDSPRLIQAIVKTVQS